MTDAPSPPDPAIVERIRTFHAEAVAAGYTDPLWGALVIAAMVVVGLERETQAAGRLKGRASAGL